MKNNFIKYLFIVVVILLIVFAVFKINKDNSKNEEKNSGENSKKQETTVAQDLRLAIVNYDSINPILSKNSNVQDISRIVFEPLITLSKDYKPEGCLATEWSISGDNSYIIKLRDNVKWHDGSSFTSKDVQFTIDKLKNIDSIYSANVQHVVQVEVIDDYTIKITLDGKDPYFEYNLTFPILSNNFYLEQDFQTTEKNNVPMGTGMYKIVSNQGGVITLKKNQNWWNLESKNAKVEEIKVNLYGSMGDAYNAFKMGNLDLLVTQNNDLEKYVGTIGYNKIDFKGREYDFLAMNCSNTFLSDVNVRKAVNFSIDKENTIATVFNGKYYSMDFPLDYGMWLYNSESSSSGYNPDQAKQLLIDSGWEYNKGYWQKKENYKTLKLAFNLTVNSDNEARTRVAEIIKANLEAIGIPVNITKVSSANYSNILQNKNYELLIAGTNIGLSPNLNTYLGEGNIANFTNDECTELLKEISNITDNEKLKEKYQDLANLYKEQSPYKSLYINQKSMICSTNLRADIIPNNYSIYYNIENWYREI